MLSFPIFQRLKVLGRGYFWPKSNNQLIQITLQVINDDTGEPVARFTLLRDPGGNALRFFDADGLDLIGFGRGVLLGDHEVPQLLIELTNTALPNGNYRIGGTMLQRDDEIGLIDTPMMVSDVPINMAQAAPEIVINVPPMQAMGVPQAINIPNPLPVIPRGVQRVSLQEPNREQTEDQRLWVYIRNGTLDFNRYRTFIDAVMTADNAGNNVALQRRAPGIQPGRSPLLRTDAYAFLKQATDYYLTEYFEANENDGINEGELDNSYQEDRAEPGMIESEQRRTRRLDDLSVQPNNPVLPYFRQVLNRLGDVFPNQGLPQFRVPNLTLLELIWSYWHEEGGLVQTMNAISLRFQNVRSNNGRDPLVGLNIDPLRPINNLIWGYIQDERFRISLAQRNHEYQYEYSLSLPTRPGIKLVQSTTTQFFLAGRLSNR